MFIRLTTALFWTHLSMCSTIFCSVQSLFNRLQKNCVFYMGRTRVAMMISVTLRQWLRLSRHSSVGSSAPTILPARVQVPTTPSTLLSFIVKFVLHLSCKKNKNKHKVAGFGPFVRKDCYAPLPPPKGS